MKIYHQPVELIIREKAAEPLSKSKSDDLAHLLDAAGIAVEGRLDKSVPPSITSKTKTAQAKAPSATYIRTKVKDSEMNPWDVAHTAAKALGNRASFIEPDLLSEFVTDNNADVPFKKGQAKGKKSDSDSVDPDWAPQQNLIWHLDNDHSQLLSARLAVAGLDTTIRIAHLDTGYSKTHKIISDATRSNPLQRNFVEGEDALDAHDRLTGGLGRMPGHGTGTLGLLAGQKVKISSADGVFNDYLGGAYFADVVPLRIASSVILIKTSALAEALQYLVSLATTDTPVHVLSMSMGGAPSKAWTEAVNHAYEAGITMVTAAGNNFGGLPTRHLIYPARYQRVLAACGITYDYKPYFHKKGKEMQGCYGPERHMNKALAAFTPNTPWAYGDASAIDFAGAGTSSATPQIAAAAAIYYRKYYKELQAMLPWQRVEAIRYALFKSASQKVKPINSLKNDFGNGFLQAFDALQVPVNKRVAMTPPDETPWFPILNTIFKAKPTATISSKLEMFNTELSQLVFEYPDLNALIGNGEKAYDKVSEKKWKSFASAVIEHNSASLTLKKHLMSIW